MKTPLRILSILLILSALPLAAFAVTPTPTPTATPSPTPPQKVDPVFGIKWDPNPENNILKYVVGSGTVTKTYTTTSDVTGPPYTFPAQSGGNLFIAIKAVNTSNQESDWSKELAVVVSLRPSTPPTTSVSSGGLVNISTRAQVSSGDKVMIAGFILTAPEKVAVRALGPSLATAGVSGALSAAQVELHDASGALVASNDGWKTGPDADALRAAGIAPTSAEESALIASLTPGNYTAIVAGVGQSGSDPDPGIGLVEVYQLP